MFPNPAVVGNNCDLMKENQNRIILFKSPISIGIVFLLILTSWVYLNDQSSSNLVTGSDEPNLPPTFYVIDVEKRWVRPGATNNLSIYAYDDNTPREDLLFEVLIKPPNIDDWFPFQEEVVGEYQYMRAFDISLPLEWPYGYYQLKVRATDTNDSTSNWRIINEAIHLINDNITIDRIAVNRITFDHNETLNVNIFFNQVNGSIRDVWYEVHLDLYWDPIPFKRNMVQVNTSNGSIDVNWTLDGLNHGSYTLWVKVWDHFGDCGYSQFLDNITINNIPAVIEDFELYTETIYRGEKIRGSFWIRDQDDDLSQNGITINIINTNMTFPRESWYYSSENIYLETGSLPVRYIEFEFITDRFTDLGTYNITILHWQFERFNISTKLKIINNPPEIQIDDTRIMLNSSESMKYHLNQMAVDFEDGEQFLWNISHVQGGEFFQLFLDQEKYHDYLTVVPKYNVTGSGSFYLICTDSDGGGDEIRFDVFVNTTADIEDPILTDDDKNDHVSSEEEEDNEENLQVTLIIIGTISFLLLMIVLFLSLFYRYYSKNMNEDMVSNNTNRDINNDINIMDEDQIK